MTYEEFWEKIIISEEEKQKSQHYLQYRGVEEHDHVRQYLESFSGEKVSYAEIATAFRYDIVLLQFAFALIHIVFVLSKTLPFVKKYPCNKQGNKS